MKLFTCGNCGQALHFDNRICIRCGARLGFAATDITLHSVFPADGDLSHGDLSTTDLWRSPARPETRFRFCANAAADICNWIVEESAPGRYCEACRHNRIVPVTDNPKGLDRWQRISQAQRHLFYSLIRWSLPRPGRDIDPNGLVFDFLADRTAPDGSVVAAMTGHEHGLISLRAAEADDATRERIRVSMNEPYRTLLGHFRHESGHFYFEQLCRDDETLAQARALFGDEREDYQAALRRNYEEGPPADWQARFISTYASSHPAEDFAECWAHYFHIVDTLETARAFGLSTDPWRHGDIAADVSFDPYRARSAQVLVDSWVPLSVALNSLQRSMGQTDIYPFVLSAPVVAKLDFIRGLIETANRSPAG